MRRDRARTHTGMSNRCGVTGSSTRIRSPSRTMPAVSTIDIHTYLAHEIALVVARQHSFHKARLEAIQLHTRIAQSGQLDGRTPEYRD